MVHEGETREPEMLVWRAAVLAWLDGCLPFYPEVTFFEAARGSQMRPPWIKWQVQLLAVLLLALVSMFLGISLVLDYLMAKGVKIP